MRRQSSFGGRLGQNMKEFAQLLFDYSNRKQQQDNWERAFNLQEQDKVLKNFQDMGFERPEYSPVGPFGGGGDWILDGRGARSVCVAF